MNELTTLFKWTEASAEELVQSPNIIENIYKAEVDGLTVKGFLSPTEIEGAIKGIYARQNAIETTTPFGYVIGKKLDSPDGNFQKLPEEKYFENTTLFREQMKAILGFDLEEKMSTILEPSAANNRPVIVPSHPRTGQIFNPATIRICRPGGGGIQPHVGNEFNTKMPEMKVLASFTRLYNQLSYFILLQKPEGGGALTLYDLLWTDTEEDLKKDYFGVFKSLTKYKQVPVPLEAGDLIIFSGGRIWHRVDDVEGSKDRITLGGFMAFAEPMDKIFYWS